MKWIGRVQQLKHRSALIAYELAITFISTIEIFIEENRNQSHTQLQIKDADKERIYRILHRARDRRETSSEFWNRVYTRTHVSAVR